MSAWEGGGGRIPAARAPGLLGASQILSASPLALFSVWVECLFLGLGDRHGGREPASSGRSEREEERKRGLESVPSASQSLSLSHVSSLVTCRGAWAQGGAFLLLGTVRVFHSSAGGDGHWHGSLRPD